MTEQDRKIIIERIERDLEFQSLREELKRRKEELRQNEAVKEFLEIEKKIKKLNQELRLFKNEEEMIYLEFIWGLTGVKKIDEEFSCEHDIWIYCGSFGSVDNRNEYPIYDEESEGFVYNKYMCLECRKFILVEDWQNFEKEKFVLKNRRDINSFKYLELYYQLLFDHPVEEARSLVIEEFNKNITIAKKKIKQK